MTKKQHAPVPRAPELTPEEKAEKERLAAEALEFDIEVDKAHAKERLREAIKHVFSVFPPATNKRHAREVSVLRGSGALAADAQPTWAFGLDFGHVAYHIENEAGSEGTIAIEFESEPNEKMKCMRAVSMKVTTSMNWASHGSMPISHCVGVLSSHLRMAQQLAELEFILTSRMGIQAGLGGRGLRPESFRRAVHELARESREELERVHALHNTAKQARSAG